MLNKNVKEMECPLKTNRNKEMDWIRYLTTNVHKCYEKMLAKRINLVLGCFT